MFRLIKLAITAIPVIFLITTNPTNGDFTAEAKRILESEQSSIRSGWSAISETLGVDALTGAAGMGMFEICRADFYVASAFRVKPHSLLGSDEVVAYGVGAATKVVIKRTKESGIASWLGPMLPDSAYSECIEAKKPGSVS